MAQALSKANDLIEKFGSALEKVLIIKFKNYLDIIDLYITLY